MSTAVIRGTGGILGMPTQVSNRKKERNLRRISAPAIVSSSATVMPSTSGTTASSSAVHAARTATKGLSSGIREQKRSEEICEDGLWLQIRSEARAISEEEPILASYLYSTILSHLSLDRSMASHLANKLSNDTMLSSQLYSLIADVILSDDDIMDGLRKDMLAIRERDPACRSYTHCMLNFKGYLAIQTHRVAHRLWQSGRKALALSLQSRSSEVFQVDIHPAAQVGKGVMLDHATGIVIGETAVIGNNVSILHGVTLSGTGKAGRDKHLEVRDGVLIGAGASVLGNIVIGYGAKIGARSLVLNDVPAMVTVVGSPARIVGSKGDNPPLSNTMGHSVFVSEWSDYII